MPGTSKFLATSFAITISMCPSICAGGAQQSSAPAAKIPPGDDPIKPETQIVVIPFPAVESGESIRLRISETYTAPAIYKLDGDELVFDRSLGRPRNAVVLPEGWYLTASSTPATITQLPDKRIRLTFWNDRPDSIDVLIKAKRRVASSSATPN